MSIHRRAREIGKPVIMLVVTRLGAQHRIEGEHSIARLHGQCRKVR
jgi:hypothetical protein